jgi:Sigma-70, region 4
VLVASAGGRIVSNVVALERVQERRRAVALARHYRDEEGLSIAEIARRLGRAEATVKAYLYDRLTITKGPAGNGRPSQEVASSRVTCPPRHHEETPFPDGRVSAPRMAVQHLR